MHNLCIRRADIGGREREREKQQKESPEGTESKMLVFIRQGLSLGFQDVGRGWRRAWNG